MGLLTTSLVVIGLVGAFFGSAYFASNIIWDDFLKDERFFTPIKLVPSGPNVYGTYDENEFYDNINKDPDRFKPRLDPNLPKFTPENLPELNPKPLPIPDDDSIYDPNSIRKVDPDLLKSNINPDLLKSININPDLLKSNINPDLLKSNINPDLLKSNN